MKNAQPVSKEQVFLHQVQNVLLPRKKKPDSIVRLNLLSLTTESDFCFSENRTFALDEERLVLSKLVVHFSFTYGVLRGTLYNYRHLSSFIFSNGLMYVNGCVSLSLLYQYFTPLPSNLQLTFTAFSVESFFMLDLFQSSKIVRRVIIFKFT